MRLRRPARPASIAALPAGSARGAPAWSPLRRPPSPPMSAYMQRVTVPIGNDGVASPATFTGVGTATAFAGPSGVGTTWEPAQASIYTSVGQLDPALATVFAGPLANAQYQVAALLAGGGSQVGLAGLVLVPGWFIWVQWTDGKRGETGFLVVTGRKNALVI